MTTKHDDADALRRLQLLFHEQVARTNEPGADKPAAAAASRAIRDVIRTEVTQRLDERLQRLRNLQARANTMPREAFMAEYAELFGAGGTAPEDILKGVLDWVGRAVPDEAMRDRVLAEAMRRVNSRN